MAGTYTGSWYTLLLMISVAISTMLAFLASRRRFTPGAPAFFMMMLAVAQWSLCFALELAANDFATKLFWAQLEYLGIVCLPFAWLSFALQVGQYSGPDWRRGIMLSLVPSATLVLIWTNQRHGLMWSSVELSTVGTTTVLSNTYGWWFWVHTIYSYTLILMGCVYLIRYVVLAPQLYRRQIGALLLGLITPWIGNVLYLAKVVPIDLTPFTFAIAGVPFAYSLFRFRFLDLTPIARNVLVEVMRDGVIVLDSHRRLLDINPAGRRMLSQSTLYTLGQPIDEILALPETAFDSDQIDRPLTLTLGSAPHYYETTISHLRTGMRGALGHLLILRDITERIRADEALRESERRYRVVSELTSDYTYALLLRDKHQLEFDWVTDSFVTITGFQGPEVMQRGWLSLVHPDDREQAKHFVSTLLAQQSTAADFRIVTKHGEVRWLRNYGRLEWNSDHTNIERILGASRDITSEVEASAALRESEQRYRLLFDSSPNPMWVHDRDTMRFIAVNDAAIRHYGYTREQFLAMTIGDLADESETRCQVWQDQAAADRNLTVVGEHRTSDGRLISVEMTMHAIVFDAQPAMIVLANDITERQRAEHALLRQNEYLAGLHETTLAIINRFDVTQVLEAIVARACALVNTPNGYLYLVETDPETGERELVAKVVRGIFTSYPDFRLAYGVGVGGTVWKTGRTIVLDDYDAWSNRSSGIEKNLFRAIVGVPLTSGDQVVGVIGLALVEPDRVFGDSEVTIMSRFAELASIALDNTRLFATTQQEIAERKRAEADLALARDQALQAAQLKSEFLAIMSHELRTPLNSIIGFTGLTLEETIGPLNDEQRNSLRRVSRNAQHLLDMINGILDISKIDAGGMALSNEPVALNEIAQTALMSVEGLALSKHLRLQVVDRSGGLPFQGDRSRLYQIVLNLLSNAVKFTPKDGKITVTIEAGAPETLVSAAPPPDQALHGSWLALSVCDTGIGIAAEEHARIWTEFYQVDTSTTRQYSGTGLGLAIVKRLTQRMGGFVGLRSVPGDGSTFTVWLPLAEPPSVDQGVDALALHSGAHV